MRIHGSRKRSRTECDGRRLAVYSPQVTRLSRPAGKGAISFAAAVVAGRVGSGASSPRLEHAASILEQCLEIRRPRQTADFTRSKVRGGNGL